MKELPNMGDANGKSAKENNIETEVETKLQKLTKNAESDQLESSNKPPEGANVESNLNENNEIQDQTVKNDENPAKTEDNTDVAKDKQNTAVAETDIVVEVAEA